MVRNEGLASILPLALRCLVQVKVAEGIDSDGSVGRQRCRTRNRRERGKEELTPEQVCLSNPSRPPQRMGQFAN